MEEYDTNNSIFIYQALGTVQEDIYKRITAKAPDIPYINICNTGIRTQYEPEEALIYLIDNINNFYTNQKYKDIIIQCAVNEIMSENL